MTITKHANPAQVPRGETLTYTLVYTNNGIAIAAGVQISDGIPITLTNLSVVYSGAAITSTGGVSFTWQVEDLAGKTDLQVELDLVQQTVQYPAPEIDRQDAAGPEALTAGRKKTRLAIGRRHSLAIVEVDHD